MNTRLKNGPVVGRYIEHTCSSPRCEEGQVASTDRGGEMQTREVRMGIYTALASSSVLGLYWGYRFHNGKAIIFNKQAGIGRERHMFIFKVYFDFIFENLLEEIRLDKVIPNRILLIYYST